MGKEKSVVQRPTVFISQDYKYVCDTCEPLKDGIKRKTLEWVGIKRGLYPGTKFESLELDGLRLLAYWNAKKPQDWGLDFHRNEGLEIGFVESGNAEFSTDTKNKSYVSLSREDFTVTKPWQAHSIGNPFLGVNKMYFIIIDFGVRKPNQKWKWPSWILLSEDDKKEFADYMSKSDIAVFKSTSELRSAFVSIGKILSSKKLDISKIALLINVIIFQMLDVFRCDKHNYSETSPSENVVKCFLEQLPNYLSEPWTIKTMAEDCGLKPTRFSYYCKMLTNLSPIEYLNEVRLKRAKELIEDSDCKKSLLDIALDCGFSTSQYFSTIFHKKYGNPPSYYIKD